MISFTKMHGLGNDYIYIDRTDGKNFIPKDNIESFVRYASNRHFGIGSDGVIFIDESKAADFKMSIYNPDGSQAEMCGNGIRCFSKYLYDNKMTSKRKLEIETLAGIRKAFLILDDNTNTVREVEVCMGSPILIPEKIPVLLKNEKGLLSTTIKTKDKKFTIYPISMGNPHAIVFVDDVDSFNVDKYGPEIETYSIFPNRTNVDFVQVIDKSNIKIRIWERGTGETFACGTGSCASSVICALKDYTKRKITVSLKGGNLKIRLDEHNNNVYMKGIATTVFNGFIDETIVQTR